VTSDHTRSTPHRKSKIELLDAEEVVFEAEPFHSGGRLDAFLTRFMSWRSRTSIQRLIKDGKVTLYRAKQRADSIKAATIVLPGDLVHVELPKPKRAVEAILHDPNDPIIRPLFEDRWLIALDKPPNVPVHPAGQHLHRTIITALHKLYRKPDDPDHDIVPKLCHRLDLETSGVLLCAKDDDAHRLVSEQMFARTPEKEYLAIVHGEPKDDHGMIDLPLGPAVGRIVQVQKGVRYDEEGRESRTEYRVERRLGKFALLRLRLHTGRMHQIRVHCSAIGHPLVGDKIYGGDPSIFVRYYDGVLTPDDHARLMLPRHALHAQILRLTHPMTQQPLEITAPLAPDMAALLDRLSNG
jgi:23S rRNA pseudouridine1911/1915/1917 synthase